MLKVQLSPIPAILTCRGISTHSTPLLLHHCVTTDPPTLLPQQYWVMLYIYPHHPSSHTITYLLTHHPSSRTITYLLTHPPSSRLGYTGLEARVTSSSSPWQNSPRGNTPKNHIAKLVVGLTIPQKLHSAFIGRVRGGVMFVC